MATTAVASVPLPVRVHTTGESRGTRRLVIGLAVLWLGLFLLLPLVAVFVEALRAGIGAYLAAIGDPDALSAIGLTLTVAAVAVPLNVVFGLAASWAVAKHEFRGKSPC